MQMGGDNGKRSSNAFCEKKTGGANSAESLSRAILENFSKYSKLQPVDGYGDKKSSDSGLEECKSDSSDFSPSRRRIPHIGGRRARHSPGYYGGSTKCVSGPALTDGSSSRYAGISKTTSLFANGQQGDQIARPFSLFGQKLNSPPVTDNFHPGLSVPDLGSDPFGSYSSGSLGLPDVCEAKDVKFRPMRVNISVPGPMANVHAKDFQRSKSCLSDPFPEGSSTDMPSNVLNAPYRPGYYPNELPPKYRQKEQQQQQQRSKPYSSNFQLGSMPSGMFRSDMISKGADHEGSIPDTPMSGYAPRSRMPDFCPRVSPEERRYPAKRPSPSPSNRTYNNACQQYNQRTRSPSNNRRPAPKRDDFMDFGGFRPPNADDCFFEGMDSALSLETESEAKLFRSMQNVPRWPTEQCSGRFSPDDNSIREEGRGRGPAGQNTLKSRGGGCQSSSMCDSKQGGMNWDRPVRRESPPRRAAESKQYGMASDSKWGFQCDMDSSCKSSMGAGMNSMPDCSGFHGMCDTAANSGLHSIGEASNRGYRSPTEQARPSFCKDPHALSEFCKEDEEEESQCICPFGADEWFAVSPDLQMAVARLAIKSLESGDNVEQDLVRLRDANILPPDFCLPGEDMDENSERCSSSEIQMGKSASQKSRAIKGADQVEATSSQLKMVTEKLVQHIICRAKKLEQAPNDRGISECDIYLDDLVRELSDIIRATSGRTSEARSSTDGSASESSSRVSVNASYNNSARNRDTLEALGRLVRRLVARREFNRNEMEAQRNSSASASEVESEVSLGNENNSHGGETIPGVTCRPETSSVSLNNVGNNQEGAENVATVMCHPVAICPRTFSVAASLVGSRRPEALSHTPPKPQVDGANKTLDSSSSLAKSNSNSFGMNGPIEKTKGQTATVTIIGGPIPYSETPAVDMSNTLASPSVANSIQDRLAGRVEDESLVAFVTEVVSNFYSTVRVKLDYLVKEQAASRPPSESSDLPQAEVFCGADREIRDLVLPTIIEHIVWLVNQDAKQRGGVVDREMAKTLAGDYVEAIVTNAVLRLNDANQKRRPVGKTVVVTSNQLTKKASGTPSGSIPGTS